MIPETKFSVRYFLWSWQAKILLFWFWMQASVIYCPRQSFSLLNLNIFHEMILTIKYLMKLYISLIPLRTFLHEKSILVKKLLPLSLFRKTPWTLLCYLMQFKILLYYPTIREYYKSLASITTNIKDFAWQNQSKKQCFIHHIRRTAKCPPTVLY